MARIHIIDDDPDVRGLIALIMELAGHSVLRCENGQKCIDYLMHEHVDLLITDVLMPDMDGLETVRAARQLQPELPIIAISGGGPFGASYCLGMVDSIGATAVLQKPFLPAELVELVSTLLRADNSPREDADSGDLNPARSRGPSLPGG